MEQENKTNEWKCKGNEGKGKKMKGVESKQRESGTGNPERETGKVHQEADGRRTFAKLKNKVKGSIKGEEALGATSEGGEKA